MHHPINANSANTLHCLGKKLSPAVSFTPPPFIYFTAFIKLARQLFGEDEDSIDELDDAEKQGENGEGPFPLTPYIRLAFGRSPRHSYFPQHKKLRIYGRRRRRLSPSALLCVPKTPVIVRQKWRFRRCSSFTVQIGLFSLYFYPKVFHSDVLNLLSMEDMWRFRDKPVPLDFDLIKSNQFVLRGQATSVVDCPTDSISNHANGVSDVDMRPSGSTPNPNGNSSAPVVNNTTVRPGHGLKDQRALSLRENLVLFVSRLVSWIEFLYRNNALTLLSPTAPSASQNVS